MVNRKTCGDWGIFMEKSNPPEKSDRRTLRTFRPLLWWFLLVLVLYGIRTHQRLMEKTRINFEVSLQGRAVDATASLDGLPAINGQNISLGSHKFTITHPKGETYATNFFNWYGLHDLGTIDLKRAMGTLVVTVDPPAPWLSVRGPECSVTLTNSSGLTQSVPTDQYVVESRYAHWGSADDVTVAVGMATAWRVAPRLGAVQLSCNQTDASFQLLTVNGHQLESGTFPAFINELPEGSYQLLAEHHQHQLDQTLVVAKSETNNHAVDFLYGKAVLETEPPGASVVDDGGRDFGLTPVTFTELTPGPLKFVLHRAGYESVPVTLAIKANQTTVIHTNLTGAGYTEAMKSGQQHMETAEYNLALQSFNDALVAKPDDAQALTLQHEATGLGHLQHAKILASKEDYIAGDQELTVALQLLPENEEIKTLLADYKQHEPGQIERIRLERLNRPKQVFDDLVTMEVDANLFEDHSLTTSKPAKDVALAIASALQYVQPAFKIYSNSVPKPETYAIVATQDDAGMFANLAHRECFIVCGQTADNETQIIFKDVEYKAEAAVKFSLGNLLNMPVSKNYIPIHPSRIPNMTDKLREQVQGGVSNLTVRIQVAINQTPAAKKPVAQ